MLPCGSLFTPQRRFPSGVHQLFLLLQVAQTTSEVTVEAE